MFDTLTLTELIELNNRLIDSYIPAFIAGAYDYALELHDLLTDIRDAMIVTVIAGPATIKR